MKTGIGKDFLSGDFAHIHLRSGYSILTNEATHIISILAGSN